MSLNARQKRCYTHRCDIWRADLSAPDPVTFEVGYQNWRLVARNVACIYEYKDNDAEPFSMIGRGKHASRRTNASIHFAYDQNVRHADLVINRTIVDGTHLDEWGEGFRLLGKASATPNSGARRANVRIFPAEIEDKLPDGVG